MEKVYVSWGLFVLAITAQILFWGTTAPKAAAMRRAGARDQIPSVFMLVALAALTASLPWPFVAASHTIALLDRGFFSILTWTLGALIAGWLLSWVIRFVAGIHMSGFGDDRAASLIGFLKVFDWVATLAVPALVTAAYVAALRQSGYYY